MKTIGQVIKDARLKKSLTQGGLSAETKIKKDFIQAIEKENWSSLPEYPVVVGFVKNIAKALDMDDRSGVALLRRDYPPKKLPINPKPDVSKEFVWSPKLTFLTGIAIVVMAILGYLIFQYISFISPPMLSVETPSDGQVVTTSRLMVTGTTDPEAGVKINNQPAIVDQNGKFTEELEVVTETKEVVVVAKSRSGKETTISRKIEVKLGDK